MALIHCPECNSEISDTATVCPHCGYDLVNRPEYEKKVTQLTDVPVGRQGMSDIIPGIIIFIGGCCTAALIWGIFVAIIGLALIGSGLHKREKRQTGDCPYCGEKLVFPKKSGAVKCPKCGNISTKTENTLESRH